MGITKAWVKTVDPALIFASLTGFGQTGGKPTRVGASIGDLAAGLYAAIGILADLYPREKTGLGDRLDFAKMDCQGALLENCMIRYIGTGKVPGPIGNHHASITPFGMFPTAEGNVIFCAGNTKSWTDLCNAMGMPELIDDERFNSNNKRGRAHDELRALMLLTLKTRATKEWIAAFEAAGVPCGPANTIADVMEDEQVKARDMIVSIDQPRVGQIQVPGCPTKSREYLIDPHEPAPELGADNHVFFG